MSRALCTVPVSYAQWIIFLAFVLTTVASWALRDYGQNVLDISPLNACLTESSPPNYGCMGEQAVLRLSFGSFMFFALHMLLMVGVTTKSSPRLAIHTGLWPLKFLLWGGLIGSTFFMSNSVLAGFGQAARVFAGFFIILQLIIVLDFVYMVNEWLLEREKCAFTLIASSFLFIVASFVGIGFLYYYYAPKPSCSLNIWFITSAIIFFLVYGIISISPIRHESAGLFTSAAVFAYSVYYVWSALNSEPESHACGVSGGNNQVLTIIGFVMAILALGFSTMSSGTSSQAFDLTTGTGVDDDKLQYRPDFFHAIFMLATCYLMMLLIGWDLEGAQGQMAIDQGWGSTWVKITASWLCAALYTWSLVAHRVLAGRQFG